MAGNTAGAVADCATIVPPGATFSTVGANLDGDATCPGFTLPGANPLLLPLADNGGGTETHALLIGSPAVNAAFDCLDIFGVAIATDQRGVVRPVGPACDLGAYEGAVSVVGAVRTLLAIVESLGLRERSLTAPLRGLLDLLGDANPHNDAAACGKLAAFLSQVRALERRGTLTGEQADLLRGAADSLRAGLGCGGSARAPGR